MKIGHKTSRVLTRKTVTSPDSHVFKPPGTIIELVQDIIGTHVLTMFHKDYTINVASRTKAITKAHHEHNTMSTLCSIELITKRPAHFRPCFNPPRTILRMRLLCKTFASPLLPPAYIQAALNNPGKRQASNKTHI
ncbi:hypothetical protein DPMN_128154 [Dreissena polymorpha]|uniref:Uncharacterized protein n=1 Tax=Dreissena polymorpha TaxID=45954 RepID=A0A9D4H2J9_DREPO|nr:hypothetical protein DPMN_128154 [Dreissena polymorpha]